MANKKERKGPKKPLTAFMFFSMENRPAVIKAEPELKFGEVAKKLGAMWGVMTEEGRAPYKTKSELDKVRFEEEKKRWDAAVPVAVVVDEVEGDEE